jgi:hypothetical protein
VPEIFFAGVSNASRSILDKHYHSLQIFAAIKTLDLFINIGRVNQHENKPRFRHHCQVVSAPSYLVDPGFDYRPESKMT